MWLRPRSGQNLTELCLPGEAVSVYRKAIHALWDGTLYLSCYIHTDAFLQPFQGFASLLRDFVYMLLNQSSKATVPVPGFKVKGIVTSVSDLTCLIKISLAFTICKIY